MGQAAAAGTRRAGAARIPETVTLSMSIKTFIFCDLCNPLCLHQIDRREQARDGLAAGRRFSDNYSWIEGSAEEIGEYGWIVTSNHKHICPRCYARHKDAVFSISGKGHPPAARG